MGIGHWLTPASMSAAAQAQQPGSDPALHGALGLLEEHRDLSVGVPTEVRELDRGAFAVGERRRARSHRLGLGEVEHLAFEIVVDRAAPRNASRSSRAAPWRSRRAAGRPTRPCTCASRNERIDPRSGS